MAVVAILFGGMLGFFSAIFSLITLDISLLAAVGMWAGVGAIVAVAVLALAFLPRHRNVSGTRAEHA